MFVAFSTDSSHSLSSWDSLLFTMSWNIPSSEVKYGWYLLKETQYWARYKTLRVSIQAIVAWKGLKKYTRCASMVSPAKKKLNCFNAFDLLNKLSFSRVEHSIPYTMWKTPTACNLVIMWSVLNKENRLRQQDTRNAKRILRINAKIIVTLAMKKIISKKQHAVV